MAYEDERNGYDDGREFNFEYLLAVMEAQRRENEARERYESEQRSIEDLSEDDNGQFDRVRRYASQVRAEDEVLQYSYANAGRSYEEDMQFSDLDEGYESATLTAEAQRAEELAQAQARADARKAEAKRRLEEKLRAAYEEFNEGMENVEREWEDETTSATDDINAVYDAKRREAYEEYIDAYNDLQDEVESRQAADRRKKIMEMRLNRLEFERSLHDDGRSDDFEFGGW